MYNFSIVIPCLNEERNIEHFVQKIDLLLQLPVYIVLFTETEFVTIFKSKRKDYGFSDITLIIERKKNGRQ